jgi:hypothetical protein
MAKRTLADEAGSLPRGNYRGLLSKNKNDTGFKNDFEGEQNIPKIYTIRRIKK